MEVLRLIIVDMSWQFAVLLGAIVICLAITGRIKAEQTTRLEEKKFQHEQTRQKMIEQAPAVNK